MAENPKPNAPEVNRQKRPVRQTGAGHNTTYGKPHWHVIYVTILLCTCFIAAILAFGGLRDNGFVQGLTGPVLTLGIVVVLYSILPLQPKVRAGVSLVAAPVFYLQALPPITGAIFGQAPITGTIYYKGTKNPVKGVVIRDPESQQSVKTDDRGWFQFPKPRPGLTELIASFEGPDISFVQKKDKKYDIIPVPLEIKKLEPVYVAAEEWKKDADQTCEHDEAHAYKKVVRWRLKRLINTEPGYGYLVLRIIDPNRTIVNVVKTEPQTEPDDPAAVTEIAPDENYGYEGRRGWRIRLKRDSKTTNVDVAICLGNNGTSEFASPDALQTSYLFERTAPGGTQ
jgi:hypothetical protein